MLFKTKSQTLDYLRKKLKNKVATIPKFIYFNVKDFNKNKDFFIKKIKTNFKSKIIIRSSSIFEDTSNNSFAGKFDSILNIDPNNEVDLKSAIEKVITSYNKNKSSKNEILIQEMVLNVKIAGVATSGDKDNLSSYYLIDYAKTNDTKLITAGSSINESFVYYKYSKLKPKNNALRMIIELLNNLVKLTKYDFIDIEFALDKKNKLYLFQCRKIVSPKLLKKVEINYENVIHKFQNKIRKIKDQSNELIGKTTLLSVMSDWNPAEMIGTKPKPLALSLYQELITDEVWAKNRASLGYIDVTGNPLMYSIFGTPYIDLRTDFNSWIPNDLPKDIAKKLVNFYLKKLSNNLHFHDKIEFNVVFTSYNFLTAKKINELKKNNFNNKEINIIKNCLKKITFNLIDNYAKNKIILDKITKINNSIDTLNISPIEKIKLLINSIKKYGTFVFSTYARCGFIAKEFLDSFVELNIITDKEKEDFLSTIQTISSKLNIDHSKLSKKLFLKKYGHIRPNTYDISSLNYKEGYSLYFKKNSAKSINNQNFSFSKNQIKKINTILKNNNFKIKATELNYFIKDSIQKREYSKYIFTKSIDHIFKNLKLIARRNKIKISDIPYISIKDIINSYNNLEYLDLKIDLNEKIKLNKKNFNLNKIIKLPQVIKNESDIIYHSKFRNEPNFIGTEKITSQIIYLNNPGKLNLNNKIVCIENADPGFDFIFLYKISGLITKFGGVNSHMSIRCSELSIPGVIGVGDKFEKIIKYRMIEIDPYNKKINLI